MKTVIVKYNPCLDDIVAAISTRIVSNLQFNLNEVTNVPLIHVLNNNKKGIRIENKASVGNGIKNRFFKPNDILQRTANRINSFSNRINKNFKLDTGGAYTLAYSDWLNDENRYVYQNRMKRKREKE